MTARRSILGLLCVALTAANIRAEEKPTPAQNEFFEKKIRPVLIEQCYECHNSSDTAEAELALDSRPALRKGGENGAVIVSGKPAESRLIQSISHVDEDLRMPEGGPRLAKSIIDDFAKWIRMGAPDPRDTAPSADELAKATSWETVFEKRKLWWSLQPIQERPSPNVDDPAWREHDVDRFIRVKLDAVGLKPAPQADRRTLIRRVTFALTGLPPTSAQVESFARDDSPHAYASLVDRLLDSPRFGERWARHWMDWFRYAGSHGSEGDAPIPYAWRYRDYLIRALNNDVAYDQLVREHIAGDLLSNPRINAEQQVNESALGIGHYRMVQHGYAPVDALDEQVRFTDNQIDVISKAFLGMTVSCARCHNHKFDAISQKDFYALYGVMASCRPALVTVDTPARANTNRAELTRIKSAIHAQLADVWLKQTDNVAASLLKNQGDWKTGVDEAAKATTDNPLSLWARLSATNNDAFAGELSKLRTAWKKQQIEQSSKRAHRYTHSWNLRGDDYRSWFRHGNGLGHQPSGPGEFHVLPTGERVVGDILPAGAYTHLISQKHNGVLNSPRFTVETDELWIRVAGAGGARVRFVIENYPRVIGLLYKAHVIKGEAAAWYRWDMSYWKGDTAHIEIATAGDLPVEVNLGAEQSWFGITDVVFRNKNEPEPTATNGNSLFALAAGRAPRDRAELAGTYATILKQCIAAWRADSLTDPQAEFLGYFVRRGLLANRLSELAQAAPLVAQFRRLEAEIPVPTRAPGVLEADAFDQRLFVRGNHKQPTDTVPRRFLEAIDSTPYQTKQSGRLQLAENLADPRNPLVARVLVNRVWHHLFGKGLVATPDNFGGLGAKPTHPELLDSVATQFVNGGWSIKTLIRRMINTRTFRAGSVVSRQAAELDPANDLRSHYTVRRLEAEAIRDAVLATSGQLDTRMFGPGTGGGSARRSVYVTVRRNSLDPLLGAFDAPEPNTTQGRRDATNVPAQSLMLLNDAFVIDKARRWADGVTTNRSLASDADRVQAMFLAALGRPADSEEIAQCRDYVASVNADRETARRQLAAAQSEIDATHKRISALTDPIRQRLLAKRATAATKPAPNLEPMARWEFDEDLEDSIGSLHAIAHNGARLEAGALVLDASTSFAQTAPLKRPLREKTLEAWVQLVNLNQRGGAAINVQTVNGVVFDALVFGEKDPGQWLAGSNNFRRTESFGGTPETEARERVVHVAITYSADGTITGYRDGLPYGKPYKSSGLQPFEAGNAVVAFGLRHLPIGGNRHLAGRIERAQLYNRALSAEEVRASADRQGVYVSRKEILATMTEAARRQHAALTVKLQSLESERTQLERDARAGSPHQAWSDLAQSLFNLKEFIYLK